MYVPEAFRDSDPASMHALMRDFPFALLVSGGAQGLQATQLPFLFEPREGTAGVLRAHFARANPHWRTLAGGDAERHGAAGEACLVVFQGESGYVTPNWYAEKARTHRVVPTWNYATVHAWGAARIREDAAWLERLVRDLTEARERVRSAPWSVGDAPRAFIESSLGAIVGIEILVTRLEGKCKMSQNRPLADREGVVAGLANPDDPHSNAALARAVGARMR